MGFTRANPIAVVECHCLRMGDHLADVTFDHLFKSRSGGRYRDRWRLFVFHYSKTNNAMLNVRSGECIFRSRCVGSKGSSEDAKALPDEREVECINRMWKARTVRLALPWLQSTLQRRPIHAANNAAGLLDHHDFSIAILCDTVPHLETVGSISPTERSVAESAVQA